MTKQIYWELIPTYGLPILFFVWAMNSPSFWASIALLAYTAFSVWLSFLWFFIAAVRWDYKWHLLLFLPMILLALYSGAAVIING